VDVSEGCTAKHRGRGAKKKKESDGMGFEQNGKRRNSMAVIERKGSL